MAVHIHDMDNPPNTAAQLRVTVQQALVVLPWGIWGLGFLYGACHGERVLSSPRMVVTSSINKPAAMPLVPFTDLQNLNK